MPNKKFIPQFSGNPSELKNFVDMILDDMTLEQLIYYADEQRATEPTVTSSGYLLPASGNWGSDHIAGVYTDLPMPIHISQSWDLNLAKRVGEVIGNERRSEVPSDDPNTVVYAAIADVRSNPLNGRYYEGYGEDPYFVGEMVNSTAEGAIGDHEFYTKAQIATKHYSTYHCEWDRWTKSNYVNCRSFHEYYLPSFFKGIKNANLVGLMSSYCSTNHIPNVTSPYLDVINAMSKYTLRNIVDFDDEYLLLNNLGNEYEKGYAKSLEEIAARLIRSRIMMLNGGKELHKEHYQIAINNAVLNVTEDDLKELIRPQIELWVRGGYFSRDQYPYTMLASDQTPTSADTLKHQEIALEAAESGFVLLKNENCTLPLKKSARILATGVYADLRIQPHYSTPTKEGLSHAGLTHIEALKEFMSHEIGSVIYAPKLSATIVRLKSLSTNKYLSVDKDGKVRANVEDGKEAAQFQLYDWGMRGYSLIHVDSDKNLAANKETGSISLISRNKQGTPPVFTFETDELGRKYFRFGSIITDVFGERNPIAEQGVPFYEIFQTMGRYLSVGDDNVLELGQNTGEEYGLESLYEVEIVSTAGNQIERYKDCCDCAVLYVGYNPYVGACEFEDRANLNLGEDQMKLIRIVSSAFPGKTIVVLRSDFPLAIEELKNNPNIASIIYASYAGQYDAYALTRLLFGDAVPSGKLTGTWLKDTQSLPQIKDHGNIDPYYTVDMKKADPMEAKMSYWYNNSDNIVYPFGYGLSYTTFTYSDFNFMAKTDKLIVTVTVTNTGDYVGSEIVQLFATCLHSAYKRYIPRQQLVGFSKTRRLKPGEHEVVEILVDWNVLQKWDVINQEYFVEQSDYRFWLGINEVISFEVAVPGKQLGTMQLEQRTNVWKSIYASSGTIGTEISKKRTAYNKGNYEAVVSVEEGDYVILPNVDLSNKTSLELTVASINDRSTIDVYIGEPAGTPIATFTFSETPPITYYLDHTNYTSVTELSYITLEQPLKNQESFGDLYLVFRQAGICVDSIMAK